MIILNIGDQPGDFAGGFAEWDFKIPNPFYEVGWPSAKAGDPMPRLAEAGQWRRFSKS